MCKIVIIEQVTIIICEHSKIFITLHSGKMFIKTTPKLDNLGFLIKYMN